MTYEEFLNKTGAKGESVVLEGEDAMAAVKKDGWALQYAHVQTPELCMAAVQQDAWALQYVDKRVFENI